MQRDFIEPDGLFATLGIDLSMYAQSRPKLAALLSAARKTGTTVLHLQNTALADRMSDSPAQIRFNLRMHKDDVQTHRLTLPVLRHAVTCRRPSNPTATAHACVQSRPDS